MEIQFIGGAYSDRSLHLNAQECENFYLHADNTGGTSAASLIGIHGMGLFKALATSGEGRGLFVWGDYVYAIVGAILYKVDSAGEATAVGTLMTSSGHVGIALGLDYMMLTDSEHGYYRDDDDTALTQITDTDFPIPSGCCYLSGKFIVTEKDTDTFYISENENPASWDGMSFASAEDEPDNVLMSITYKKHFIVFGTSTVEVFYPTADESFPYARVAGAVIPIGIGAVRSVASGPEGLFFLDSQYRVRSMSGYDAQVISTPQIEYQINRMTTKSDAIGMVYSFEGHAFYVLLFLSEKKTLCYDVTTSAWHSRSVGASRSMYKYSHCAFYNDKHLFLDSETGKICYADSSLYTDNGDTIKAVRVSQPVRSERKMIFHHNLEIDFETGVGIATGQGSDPVAIIDWSDDDGGTWSNEMWATMGKIGERTMRCRVARLGSSRQRIYRVAITDPVKRVIVGAHLDATVGER